jgi:hypothetical protein
MTTSRNKRRKSEEPTTTKSYKTSDMIEESMFNTLSAIPEEDSEQNEYTFEYINKKIGKNIKNSNKKKNLKSRRTTSSATSLSTSRAKKTSKFTKVKPSKIISKNNITKTTAPGVKAEKNFCDRLQPIINKPLTPQEKNILINAIYNFSNIYPNYFTQKLINDIRNKEDFKITKIEQVGATKSNETKKKMIF